MVAYFPRQSTVPGQLLADQHVDDERKDDARHTPCTDILAPLWHFPLIVRPYHHRGSSVVIDTTSTFVGLSTRFKSRKPYADPLFGIWLRAKFEVLVPAGIARDIGGGGERRKRDGLRSGTFPAVRQMVELPAVLFPTAEPAEVREIGPIGT